MTFIHGPNSSLLQKRVMLLKLEERTGKHKFDIPFLVAQSGRPSTGPAAVVEPIEAVFVNEAMSLGGQVRFVPALMDNVGWPH